jgi:putative membrane protein
LTREFVTAAAQSDEFERMEATTALAQSQDPDVRAFATKMLAAHAETSRTLMDATSSAGLMPPQPGLSGDQSAFLAALQSARGHDFDQLYARQQALAHRAALATEQGYAARGDMPTIKKIAASTAGIIVEHLAMADRLAARMGDD